MFKAFFFLFPTVLFGQLSSSTQDPSLLEQSQKATSQFSQLVVKLPPPDEEPQTQACLDQNAVWFTIDLNQIASEEGKSVLETLSSETLWDGLKEIGVQSVYLQDLKAGGPFRTGLSIDPKWGTENDWAPFFTLLQKKGIESIARLIDNRTGLSSDFSWALRNEEAYSSLYHLIEIPAKDWNLLPSIPQGRRSANIPWLSLQGLYQKGYVPQDFSPYVKVSQWNATAPLADKEGIRRRWIYLKEGTDYPVFNWLNSSCNALQIALADALVATQQFGQKIFFLPDRPLLSVKETFPLWIRKLKGFSVQEISGGLKEMAQTTADFQLDTLTQPALLHALIAQDAEALRIFYRLFLEAQIQPFKLVHRLQPFDQFATDWQEFLQRPKKSYLYYEEIITAEALRKRLLREDLAHFQRNVQETIPPSTWPGYCASALGIKEALQNQEPILNAHLLLAFFYAMQPGIFSFSLSDLLGALPEQQGPLNLMGSNENTLYPSLPNQLGNRRSFASQLRQILAVRKEQGLQNGELIEVPQPAHPGTFLLLLHLKESETFQVLAMNFGSSSVQEKLERSVFRNTTAIDLLDQKALGKPFSSSSLLIDLPPLSGKVFLFYPKKQS